MLRAFLLLLLAAPAGAETRCGWYHHNSATNLYLEDADGLWVIWEQGITPNPIADDAYPSGFEDRTVMDYGGNIVTTDYAKRGVSCVCAKGAFGEPGSGVVHAISRFTALPLAQCETDPNLPPVLLSGQ
jgi:hypothetical protein